MPDDGAIWRWSRTSQSPVVIVNQAVRFDHPSIRVWEPATDIVRLCSPDDLVPLHYAPPTTASAAVLIAAIGRINASIAENMLLAPLDAPVIPLPHQITALHRSVSRLPVRMLLADEVGLGKTIEAGLIIRELKLRGMARRVLIVVPKGLVGQWVAEMDSRFGEAFESLLPSDFTTLRRDRGDANPWRRFDQVVTAMDSIKPLRIRRGWTQQQVERHNRERFDALVDADWDVIVVDEAHRLAGADDSVARYELGRGLSAAAPNLLLLSATPHSGKTDAFHRLVALLDERTFPSPNSVTRNRVLPFVARTEKRAAVDIDDRPIFLPRVTRLVPVDWGSEHRNQQLLYDAVTEYVREGYNRAMSERRFAAGFLLILFQRLVTSSTAAIRSALELRLAALDVDNPETAEPETEGDDTDTANASLLRRGPLWIDERIEVQNLLALAQQTALSGPDAKALRLLELVVGLEVEELDPQIKVLVFTQFIATQRMIRDFFAQRGYSVGCLNGGMDIDERREVQSAFAGSTRILISTEAGGEGLNLQFCHIVVNYDLPWNPMRIEQRIGRVDRIGQRRPVRAFNLTLRASVEHRLQEVLEQKLRTIFDELGVDKLSDVLDSGDVEADFERMYVKAVVQPEQLESEVSAVATSLLQRASATVAGASMLRGDGKPDSVFARNAVTHPLPNWVRAMTINAAYATGGTVRQERGGVSIDWADGDRWSGVGFRRDELEGGSQRLVTVSEPRLQQLLKRGWRQVPGQPVARLRMSGLVLGVSGFWSLWQVSAVGGPKSYRRYFPLFLHDNGTLLIPSARRVWDAFVDPESEIVRNGIASEESSSSAWSRLQDAAAERARSLYADVVAEHSHWLTRERETVATQFAGRTEVASRSGPRNVSAQRLRRLDTERQRALVELDRAQHLASDVFALLMVHVEPLEPQ